MVADQVTGGDDGTQGGDDPQPLFPLIVTEAEVDDILGGGCGSVGSPTILRFIQERQPLLGCSGHIHESPYQQGGHWAARVSRAMWIQPGQVSGRLHYACCDITDDLSIRDLRHNIFGSFPDVD